MRSVWPSVTQGARPLMAAAASRRAPDAIRYRSSSANEAMIDQLPTRRGHFLLESGHHGDVWLDLELLFLRPDRVRPFAQELATRLEKHRVDVICGPLVEGAFLGLMVASEMGLPFTYSQPLPEEKP